jgi:hypothetical protein
MDINILEATSAEAEAEVLVLPAATLYPEYQQEQGAMVFNRQLLDLLFTTVVVAVVDLGGPQVAQVAWVAAVLASLADLVQGQPIRERQILAAEAEVEDMPLPIGKAGEQAGRVSLSSDIQVLLVILRQSAA